MCGYCHAMTAKEAESYYERIKRGEVVTPVQHVFGESQGARGDLKARLKAELDYGEYAEDPAFRAAMLDLVEQGEKTGIDGQPLVSNHEFEHEIVRLRSVYGRPMLTEHEMDVLLTKGRAMQRGKPARREHEMAGVVVLS